MALTPIRTDQDAFASWWLQPTGVDPGDALGFFGVATPGERNALQRKGYLLLGNVEGDMSDPESPLRISAPPMSSCERLLKELKKRVKAGRAMWRELLEESRVISTEAGLSVDERKNYRDRVKGFQRKIEETYRVTPMKAAERRRHEKEIVRLQAIVDDDKKLADDRKEARDAIHRLEHELTMAKNAQPYTAAGFRRYFIMCQRVQMEMRIPRPHFEVQQRLAQIAQMREEELSLTTLASRQEREAVDGDEEEERKGLDEELEGEGEKENAAATT